MKVIDFSQYKNTPALKETTNKKFFILIGLPCSGKSTYAVNLSKENDAVIVSSDDIRAELFGDLYCTDDNEEVFDEVYKKIYVNMRRNKGIIFDATNISKAYREPYIELAKQYSYEIHSIVIDTPLAVCIDRNKYRSKEKQITKAKMRKINKYYEKPALDEGFDEISYI